jgi:hypothetical protein
MHNEMIAFMQNPRRKERGTHSKRKGTHHPVRENSLLNP